MNAPERAPLTAGGLFAGDTDTIAAIATPHGRGALAIVRMSGRDAHAIGNRLAARWPTEARVATRTTIRGLGGIALDDAILIRFDAPASYTGEDAVEIMTHGGAVVPATVVAAAIELGAREARPGEFTRRAVFNGKLDLLQAEATGDLVAATSRSAQQVALRQLEGGLSRRIDALRSQLLEVEALLAYDIDFPEEDAGPVSPDRILTTLSGAKRSLEELLATTRTGEMVREGAMTVLSGVPNAGKSSLFNALLGQPRAIVTDIPGTTRDAIEAVLDAGRWPLRLADTAGLRDSDDVVERLGVEVSTSYIERATVVLACGESVEDLRRAATVVAASGTRADLVLVATKADLHRVDSTELEGLATETAASSFAMVSAAHRTGLDELVETIMRVLDNRLAAPDVDAPILTHARHRHVISRALSDLEAFHQGWRDERLPVTVAAVHLRAAVSGLEDLIGSVDVEHILDEVFSRFCVGK